MPVYEINGQQVELTDREAQDMVRRLCQLVERQLFNPPRFRFDRWYDTWRYHENAGAYYIVRMIIETAGGVDLPPASEARRLKRTRDRLLRLINPRGISQFFDLFPTWQRRSSLFCNRMVHYQDGMDIGGARTVRVLEVTRDVSFITLQVCAALSTAGASTAASASVGAGTVLARTAATNFVVREMQNGATRLGRVMAGDPPSTSETVDQITESAILSVQGAALGQLVGLFMRPMSDAITSTAVREIQRGNLASGVTLETVNSQLGGIIENTITRFMGTNEADVRRLIQQNRTARDGRVMGGQMAAGLMRNRSFRRQLEQNIERAADRGR